MLRSYKIRKSEAATDAMVRVLLEHEAFVRESFALRSQDPSETLHQIRKALKRMRSVLRLCRGINARSVRPLEARVRDQGRALSVWRDEDAMLEALAAIAADPVTSKSGRKAVRAVMEHLSPPAGRRSVVKGAGVPAEVRRRVLRQLHQAVLRTRVILAEHTASAEQALVGELTRFRERLKKRARAFRTKPDAETLHDLRKEVKHLWHATLFLGKRGSGQSMKEVQRLDEWADHLGAARDAEVLASQLEKLLQGDDATGNPALRQDVRTVRKLAQARARRATRVARRTAASAWVRKLR